MSIITSMSNGWTLTKTSLKIINENRSLLLFPVFSTISLLLVLATFFTGSFFLVGDEIDRLLENDNFGPLFAIGIIFIYYLINYFIIIFFNAALIHCAINIMNNKPMTLWDGIQYAKSKITKIFAWSIISATVGTILQLIQNTGKIGELIASFIGMAWSFMTFFVVPIIIYEDKGVFESIKGSADIVKQKWGESLASNISLGLFYALGLVVAFLVIWTLFPFMQLWAVALGLSIFLGVATVVSAAKSVFVAALYNRIEGLPTSYFDDDILDSVFITKR